MRELFFRSLSPGSQFVFLLFICFSTFLLFSFLGSTLITNLYGFDTIGDMSILNRYDLPYVIAANKILLVCQHIGLFILPALVFNQLFTFSRSSSFLFWGEHVKWDKMLFVLLLMAFAFPVINFLVEINAQFKFPQGMEEVEKEIRAMEDNATQLTYKLINTSDLWTLLINIFVIGIIPAVGEEFIFRGVLQKLFARLFNNVHLAIWICAIIFSALHFQFYGFLPRLLLGVMFGYITIWTGSVWYAVFAHLINNAGSLLIIYFTGIEVLPENAAGVGAVPGEMWIAITASIGFGLLLWGLWRRSVFPVYANDYLVHRAIDLSKRDEADEDLSG